MDNVESVVIFIYYSCKRSCKYDNSCIKWRQHYLAAT